MNTHEILCHLGDDVAQRVQSTIGECESRVRVCLEGLLIDSCEGDAGHGVREERMRA